jgi:hypothetical protein
LESTSTSYCGIREFQIYSGYPYIIRSINGGNVYLGTDGNVSLTDKSLGAWPNNNEWDKYIIKSSLGDKITPGDDNVWHYKNMYSYCQDSPIICTWNDSLGNAVTSANDRRICRGNNNRNMWKDVNFSVGTTGVTTYGFRPVLEYIESGSKQTNFYY